MRATVIVFLFSMEYNLYVIDAKQSRISVKKKATFSWGAVVSKLEARWLVPLVNPLEKY